MDLKELFDSFYNKLILRDLFGKIVPSSILIISVILSLFDFNVVEAFINKMPFPLWIIFIGFAWLLGFSLQYIGEATRLLKTHPSCKDKSDKNKSGENKTETYESFYLIWVKFQNYAKPYEKLQAERLSIIKEACGNSFVSIMLSCIFISTSEIIKGSFTFYPLLVLIILGMLIAISLCRMHVSHIERYGKFLKKTNDHYEKFFD